MAGYGYDEGHGQEENAKGREVIQNSKFKVQKE
jgi:hypothetical protein